MLNLKRYINFLILLFWGAFFIRFWNSEELANYLHPGFHSLVLLTGIGLIFLSVGWYWAIAEGMGGMSNCGCCSKHDVEPPTQKLRIKDVAVFLILMGLLAGRFFCQEASTSIVT